jgi:hypothetical protein
VQTHVHVELPTQDTFKTLDIDEDWFTDYSNIISLSSFLVEVKGIKAKDLCYFIEKPHKYTDEFIEMKWYIVNEIYPYGDNNLEDFIDRRQYT